MAEPRAADEPASTTSPDTDGRNVPNPDAHANEAWARVRPFMAKHGINYTIAIGDDAISKSYSLNQFPDTYLIDKSRRIAVAYVGLVVNKDNVAANIKKLLAEQ